MRAIVQRVQKASVTVANHTVSEISGGLLVLLGVHSADTVADILWLAKKIANMRIFDDKEGNRNSSVKDVNGEMLVVSQFTLYASTKKGNRPSYINAAKGEFAEPMYLQFVHQLELEIGAKVGKGIFGADMQVSSINDGPVTIIIDSRNRE